ncbi:unnamed protein product [Caenorhabditis brenneri]
MPKSGIRRISACHLNSNSNLDPLSDVDDVDSDSDQDENIDLYSDADLIIENNSDSDLDKNNNSDSGPDSYCDVESQESELDQGINQSSDPELDSYSDVDAEQEADLDPSEKNGALEEISDDENGDLATGVQTILPLVRKLCTLWEQLSVHTQLAVKTLFKANRDSPPKGNHACPFFGSAADRNKEHSQQRTITSVKPPTSFVRPRKSPRTKTSKTDN